MSALQRTRRSRSKTAPDTGGDSSLSNGLNTLTNPSLAAQSPTPPPQRGLAPPLSEPIAQETPESDFTMAETLVVPKLPTTVGAQSDETQDGQIEADENQSDNRSSSLSELGDGLDDQDEPTPRAHTVTEAAENDSEAETERLDNTPRKLLRTSTNVSMLSETIGERTPSKLSNTILSHQDGSGPPSPLAMVEHTVLGNVDADMDINSVSIMVGSENESITATSPRKRKRSSPDGMSADELESDEPARKRSDTGKSDTISADQDHTTNHQEQADLEDEEEDDSNEKLIPRSAEEELDIEETAADVAEEAVGELAEVAKIPPKPRKSKRKGKKSDESTEGYNGQIANDEGMEVDANEGDNDDDEGSAHDEEVVKKKAAIDSLAKIEKKFKIFREKWCDESLAQLNKELEMLRQPNCTHPEYLAMIHCIDERRAEKIDYEKRLFDYKQKSLDIKIFAERHQLFSQYFQTARDIREQFLSECNERIYQLQRGRRQLGVDETEFSYRFPEKRSQQIQQQRAYNLEVSILSGVAKYVGFPAAPEIAPARPSEIEDDLRAMKIATRPAPAPYIRPYNRPSRADEAAAEEQFIEQTPWANPQHPAHLQSHYPAVPNAPSGASSQTYQTPAGQRRIVDVHATNGSASTIDMLSNPPSSTAAQGHSVLDSTAHARESESPLLQMKRIPSEHRVPSEGPGSQPRNFAGLGRESYTSNSNMLSSPAGASARIPDQSTPLPAAARSEPGRPPLSQRTGLGPVSVGSGSGLFGR